MSADDLSEPMRLFPALAQFVQCYLHQDWPDDYAEVWDALTDFKSNERPELVQQLAADIDAVLARCTTEEEVQALLIDGLDTYYWAPGDGLSFKEWFAGSRARLAAKP